MGAWMTGLSAVPVPPQPRVVSCACRSRPRPRRETGPPRGIRDYIRRMRALGLDVGSKTIGVAASDELGWTAQAVFTVRRTNLRADLAQIKKVMDERGI